MKRGTFLSVCLCLLFVWGCPGAVFYSERDGRAQIYKTDDSGILQGNISNNLYQDRYPEISPDASQVAFASERAATGDYGIYIMDLDGGAVRPLVAGSGRRIMPRWGQNGLIAFTVFPYPQNPHIRAIKSDGTNERQLTSPGSMESDDGGHDFFSAGSMIVFSRKDLAGQMHDLFVAKSDGTGTPKNITNSPAIDETLPAVSHDGLFLACRAVSPGQTQETIRLYDVKTWTLVRDIPLPSPAGSVITGLGFTQGDDRLYVSAEATDVASQDARRKQEIFVVKTDGTLIGRLTTNEAFDSWPAAIAKKEQYTKKTPVLFIHGHSNGADVTWKTSPGAGLASFEAAFLANPDLPVARYYLELPLHVIGSTENLNRSITADAEDILAAIEGGPDSKNQPGWGILKMPEFQDEKVVLVGYSQGTISSRYYLKNLMGKRLDGRITVSEFVALAAPNHGVGDSTACWPSFKLDKSTRQLCGGWTADEVSQANVCGSCPAGHPERFMTNDTGDDDIFMETLNGHSFVKNCNESSLLDAERKAEAPKSRPGIPDGVLYVNLYAAGNADQIVGGQNQAADCIGRRLARNHSPDAQNMGIAGVPGSGYTGVHFNFPHYWPTICVVLKTIVNHAAPANQTDACQGLNQP